MKDAFETQALILDGVQGAPYIEITSDVEADQALAKIIEAEEERDRVVELCKVRKAQLIAELDEKISAAEREFSYETAQLQEGLFNYLSGRDKFSSDTKTQRTYKLAAGTLIAKKPTRKINKPDKDRMPYLIQELKQNGLQTYLKHIEEVDWVELKKALEETQGLAVVKDLGVVLETVDVIETPETFAWRG